MYQRGGLIKVDFEDEERLDCSEQPICISKGFISGARFRVEISKTLRKVY